MNQRIFLVDTEATSPTPFSGVMTEFGIVDFETRHWFHGHLYDSAPHPDIPALPVLAGPGLNPWVATDTDPWVATDTDPSGPVEKKSAADVFGALADWLAAFGGRPSFVADNPAFDWQWIAYGFDEARMKNPFGHSARRIGDLAAGLEKNWRKTSAWKRYRKTRHDHTPVNDSLGNAEALHTILTRHSQI